MKSPWIPDSEGFELIEGDICKRQKCNCKSGYEHHIAGIANPLGWDCQLVPPENVISTSVSYLMANMYGLYSFKVAYYYSIWYENSVLIPSWGDLKNRE